MAIVTDTKFRGQKRTDAIGGQLSFDQDQDIIIVRKNGKRLLGLGVLPGSGGDIDLLIMKDGWDIEDAYTP